MSPSAREAYVETQILTATPQRLRLMLIEGALRRARAAQAAWLAGDVPGGLEAIGQCRDIVTELIAGIQPEQSPVARQVLGIYMFLYSTLVEAQFARDEGRLTDIIRVLDEERVTWQEFCVQYPERIAADPATPQPLEELAPQRVAASRPSTYSPASASAPAPAGFSIDA
jgi:flagellar secretion chaperone FliS